MNTRRSIMTSLALGPVVLSLPAMAQNASDASDGTAPCSVSGAINLIWHASYFSSSDWLDQTSSLMSRVQALNYHSDTISGVPVEAVEADRIFIELPNDTGTKLTLFLPRLRVARTGLNVWRSELVSIFHIDLRLDEAPFMAFDVSARDISIDSEGGSSIERRLTPAQLEQMYNASELGVLVEDGAGPLAAQTVRVARLRESLDELRRGTEQLEADIEAAGGECEGCIMTTAAVHMLGRPDDCFELTQMRRLRAAFPEHAGIVADYIETGRRLLARPADTRLKAGLLAFYLLAVWPTAWLVRLGATSVARAVYLGAFSVFKRFHADRLRAHAERR